MQLEVFVEVLKNKKVVFEHCEHELAETQLKQPVEQFKQVCVGVDTG
jgi:hypothetical protein